MMNHKPLAAVIVLLLPARSTTPPRIEPFQQFLDAATQVAESADQALAIESERYRSSFESSVKGGDKKELAKLFLTVDQGDPYHAYYANEPVFSVINGQREQLGRLNQLVARYAELLVRVVGDSGSYDKDEQASVINRDLNQVIADYQALRESGASAVAAVKAGIDPTALLSTAFTASVHAYIEKRRREDLAVLLKQGQPIINEYANQGAYITQTAAATLTEHYDSHWKETAQAPGDKVKNVLSLNRSYLDQLGSLKQLKLTFLDLARSHARLADSVAEGGEVSFESLIGRVKELKALYEKLSDQKAKAVAGG